MATSMAAATIGHVKLLRPLRAGAWGYDATFVLAGVLPVIVCVVLYVVAGLRRDEDLHPLLGDAELYAGAGVSSADSGSGTPAIS
jgi:hypothetical protein